MNPKKFYIILTGSKTNSGDHLIKDQAIRLMKMIRPERDVINMNGWEKITDENLNVINKAEALILLGGPALRRDTYPDVYPLRDDLNDITVPISSIGIGFRTLETSYESTKNFEFTSKTLLLLKRIERNNFRAGVRDFLTLNTLLNSGFRNFQLSGCPAMFDEKYIGHNFNGRDINSIAFAIGRRYLKNKDIYKQQLRIILSLKKYFNNKSFTIAFHDPIDISIPQTDSLIKLLKENGIEYIDISKTSQNLRNFYAKQDLQIGYRVHAHIHMASINKPSVLLCEDSRGIGIRTVLNGLIFNAYNFKPLSIIDRVKIKIDKRFLDHNMIASDNMEEDIIANLENEILNDFPRMKATRKLIDHYYLDFTKLIKNLP